MIIRKEQMEAMVAARQAESEQSFVTYFRKEIPHLASKYNDDALRSLIRQGVARAGGYGIVRGPALVRFLTLSLLIPDFPEEAATNRFLLMPGLDADIKLELLTRMVCDRLRHAVM